MVDDATKAKALEIKEKGNAAYKKKNLEEAIQLYTEAYNLDPTNVTFLTNRAAAHFENGDNEKCREDCLKAVEDGRANRVEYKYIATAFNRIGTSYLKEEDFDNAIKYFDKSLTEHRTPNTLQKRQEAVKRKQEKEAKAYIDPEKSLLAKEEGNKCFKAGQFPEAVKHYTEAIKRNPEDAKLFSNRAACYTKLAEFKLGLADCDECIRLDPDFIKGYIRKGTILLGLKDTAKAKPVFEKALELDPKNHEANEGLRKCFASYATPPANAEEAQRRALADPEVREIMMDPAMRLILEQMQSQPEAAAEHLKNPDIRQKVMKLMECGLLQMR